MQKEEGENMALTKDELITKIIDIGTVTDDVERRTHLADIKDEVSGLYDTYVSLVEENEKFKADNETLRTANMQLFLRVGEKREDDTQSQQQKDSDINNLKYEDLFDEKGDLK